MTSREVVRTTIVVGGLWLIFSALSSAASSFSTMAEAGMRLDRDPGDFASDFLWLQLPTLLMILIFGVGPGLYAIFSSHAWAARLSPADTQMAEVGPSLVLSVGSMLLGLSIGVSGAISLAVGAGLTLMWTFVDGPSFGPDPFQARMGLNGLFSLIAGILLFQWGSRGVLRAA